MIKKLDKLILKEFFWPFIASFLVALIIFMMQIIWKYVDDLVGKGLDLVTVSKFVIYASATLVTYALPISILLSSIMTFGNMGERFELVAIKSSGISLIRFMRPMFIVAIILSGITFLFANYIIPVANLKFAVLYTGIYNKSPAFDLKDGVFYNGLRGYSIKVAKKDKDRVTLHNIIIYEQTTGPQDNCINAEEAMMRVSTDKKFLELDLKNGFRYEEKGDVTNPRNDFTRVGFKQYKKLFDLSQLDIKKTADSVFRNGYKMQNMRQLDKLYDSMKSFPVILAGKSHEEMRAYFNFLKYDKRDTIKKVYGEKVKDFDKLIPDSLKNLVSERLSNTLASLKNVYNVNTSDFDEKAYTTRLIGSEWHQKITIPLACLVLFFIGAPLGSIIRKGGLGVPLVLAIIFFLIFHLLNMYGERFVSANSLTVFGGIWLPIFILTPVGFFLTYEASRDSQIFSKEYYYRTFKWALPFFSLFFARFRRKEQDNSIT